MVRTTEESIALEVALRDGVHGCTWSLNSAIPEIALKGYDALDEMTSAHVRVLACLCTGEPFDLAQTMGRLGVSEEAEIEERLDTLLEARYAHQTRNGYEATPAGKTITRLIGVMMLQSDQFKAAQSQQLLERFFTENQQRPALN